LPRLFGSLVKADLLILDDWGPDRLNPSQRRDLMEIVEDRSGARSTLGSCRGVGGNSKAASSPGDLKPTQPAAPTAREVRAFLPPVRRNARTHEPDY
jgi:hypothetical protein